MIVQTTSYFRLQKNLRYNKNALFHKRLLHKIANFVKDFAISHQCLNLVKIVILFEKFEILQQKTPTKTTSFRKKEVEKEN